ncbi:MAG: MerR family transcriptional regulator [Sphingobacteriales bacterium]|nr:MAG: MerR family transcriptional regulator [Sphingobacteriales bacterium]
MNRFSIKDIENLTGIRAHTIRIWEQRYGILQPKRTATNIRYYDALDLKLALRIALLNSYGYKISRIHQMTDGDMNALIQKINDNEFKLQMLVNELLDLMLTMQIDEFEERVNDYIKQHGIEHTVEQLLFQFLEKIGIMWMTDRIYPAQEHLVCNVIYRKLALGIEHLPKKSPDAGPQVVLFLPEGEVHDIGLMYVNFILRKYGKSPIYLGPNTPLEDVRVVCEQKNPEYLYLHLTSVAHEFDAPKYFQKLHAICPGSKILVSGGLLKHSKHAVLPNMRYLSNLQEAKSVLISV